MKLRPSTTDQAITLVVLAVLVAGVYLVLEPFLSAIVWAAILAATDLAALRLDGEPRRPAAVRGDACDAAHPDRGGRAVRDRRLDAGRERGPPDRVHERVDRTRSARASGMADHDSAGGRARGCLLGDVRPRRRRALDELRRFVDPLRTFAFKAGARGATACCSSPFRS